LPRVKKKKTEGDSRKVVVGWFFLKKRKERTPKNASRGGRGCPERKSGPVRFITRRPEQKEKKKSKRKKRKSRPIRPKAIEGEGH